MMGGRMFEPETKFVKSEDPIVSVVDDEIVMLSLREGAYFSFNGVASEIWNLLDAPKSIGEICRTLSAHYRVDETTVSREVGAFLASIVDRGLARRLEAP